MCLCVLALCGSDRNKYALKTSIVLSVSVNRSELFLLRAQVCKLAALFKAILTKSDFGASNTQPVICDFDLDWVTQTSEHKPYG